AGLEVVSVLLLGNVCKTKAFDMGAKLELAFLIAGIERQMVDRATREGPGSLRALTVSDHLNALVNARRVGHNIDVPIIRYGLQLQRQGDGQEIVHRGLIGRRDDAAINALDAVVAPDTLLSIGNRLAAVALAFDELVRNATGMGEDDTLGAKARDLMGRDSTGIKPVHPEIGSAFRNGLENGAGLVGAATPIDARLTEREGGDDGGGVAIRRAVIEMVDRQHAVKQHGALDRVQTERLGVE